MNPKVFDTLVVIVAMIIAIIVMLAIVGCTTLTHEPTCLCDCNSTASHFECGGRIHHEELEFQ